MAKKSTVVRFQPNENRGGRKPVGGMWARVNLINGTIYFSNEASEKGSKLICAGSRLSVDYDMDRMSLILKSDASGFSVFERVNDKTGHSVYSMSVPQLKIIDNPFGSNSSQRCAVRVLKSSIVIDLSSHV